MRPFLAGELPIFLAVARHKSFRRAAAELGLSTSGLSDRLRRLETHLGTRLFNRTTRSPSLTERGADLLKRIEPALAEISSALDEVGGADDAAVGTLRLNAPQAVAQLVLPHLLTPFLAAHPGVTVDLVVEDGFVDIVAAGFDAGLRYGESLAQDMIAVPIGPTHQRYKLVATPDFVSAHGTPKTPEDLIGMPAIVHRFPGGYSPSWHLEREGRTVTLRPMARLTCSDPQVELAAAVDGLGLLMTFEEWTRPFVQTGQLVSLLDDWFPSFPGPFLYYPSRRHLPSPLRAFVDFARAHTRIASTS